MSYKTLLTMGAGLALSATALAGSNDLGNNAGRTQISLSDLRDHCTEILGNPQMVKPQVDVVCDQTQVVWQECPSAFNLSNSQSGRATIGLKGWMAYAPSQNAPVQNQHACSTFQKHQLYVRPVSQAMRCEDLLSQFKSEADLSAFCTNLVAQRLAADPTLMSDTPLSDTFSTCNGQYGTPIKGEGNQAPAQCAPVAPVSPPPSQAPSQGAQAPSQGAQAPAQGAQAPAQGAQAPAQGAQAPSQGPSQASQAPGQSPGQAPVMVDSNSDSPNF